MEENISYKLDKIEKQSINADFFKLYDELDKIVLADGAAHDTILDKIIAFKLDYITNYTVQDLKKILDFYITHKDGVLIKIGKKNKNELIESIVDFELDNNNMELVCKRKRLWFYVKEIKNDKYLSKYIIFN
tara:strand:- start:1771 stop:2166 length:396 start_codon:yes stop_codon:yes gene_type:complete